MNNNELYNIILNSSMDAVFILHPDGNFCESNSMAYILFQYTSPELQQLGWCSIAKNENRIILQNAINSPALTNSGTFIASKKDETCIKVKFTATKINTAGGVYFTCISFRDISEIIELQEQVNFLHNNTKEPFLFLNKNLKVVFFNKEFSAICKQYFGIDVKKNENILMHAKPELKAERKKMYVKVLTGSVEKMEMRLPLPGVIEKKLIVTHYPARDNNEKIIGIFITAIDITNETIAQQRSLISEQKYRSLFYSIPLPMWIYDQETKRFLDVNEQAIYAYGYSREEFAGMTIYDIRPEEDIQKLVGLKKIKKGNILSYNGQWRHLKKSKEVIDVDITSHVIEYEGREAILVIAQNITDKLKIEKQNEFEKRDKEALINSTTDLMWSVDKDFNLIAANKEFIITLQNWTGILLKPGDNLFRNDKFLESFIIFWKKNYEKALGGKSFKKEIYYPSVDGSIINWIETSFNPIYNNNAVIGIACYSRNITDRKNAELKQRKAAEQQALFVSIVNSSDDAIISKTLEGIITSWNPGAEKLFGYTAKEAVGNNISIIIPLTLLEEEHGIIQKIKQGKYVDHYETERIRRDGSVINVSLTISPVLDSNNVIIGVSKIARDITEKKKSDKILQAALNERNTILESIGDAFFTVDKNWTVTYWNREAEKMLAVPRTTIIGRGLWEIFADSINTLSYQKYYESIETNQVIHFEDFFPPLEKWFEISAYPSDSGLSVYFKDITQRKFSEIKLKALNASLHQQAKELAVSNADLEQFAYVASHDLQEPLRMVTSFLTQIEKKYGDIIDEKGKKYIAFAVDGAKRMRQIILDLLEFSRIGRTEESHEELDLNELVKEIKILFRKQVEEKKAIITVDKLPLLYAYKSPMRQVFQNLISNALKYSNNNDPCQIHISVEENTEGWQFCITDNGIGIDKEFHQKIFVIFQRLHNKDEYSGTGMGLAVTKKIIENWGGKIWVVSEEGKGSRFYFTILKN